MNFIEKLKILPGAIHILIKKIKREFAFTASFNRPDQIFIGKSTCICAYSFLNAGSGKISIGENCHIDRNVILSCNNGNIEIGNHCSFNPFCVIYGGLKIGNDVRIATGTVIVPFNHGFKDKEVKICDHSLESKGVIIENNCWIGANVTILDGVTIGEGSVIGAGSVVTKSIPSFSVVVGNPAKVIKER
ncbi:MAG: hypothetical protein ACD_79C00647G0003 [uncultured bacterium]|nr:MAG: hypothetical protein ACD_79C00647G0003 [uncultured bacterium]